MKKVELSKDEEGKRVLKINSKASIPLASSLINISSGIVKYLQHGDNPIARTVRSVYMATICSDVMNV